MTYSRDVIRRSRVRSARIAKRTSACSKLHYLELSTILGYGVLNLEVSDSSLFLFFEIALILQRTHWRNWRILRYGSLKFQVFLWVWRVAYGWQSFPFEIQGDERGSVRWDLEPGNDSLGVTSP